MLTIRAMVRIGPWMVTGIDYLDDYTTECDRCGATIKEVWCCQLHDENHGAPELGGKRAWRIGSTCGPTLMMVSDEIWKNGTGGLRSDLRLLKDVEAVLAQREKCAGPFEEVEKHRAKLIEGTLGYERKRLRFITTKLQQRLGLR